MMIFPVQLWAMKNTRKLSVRDGISEQCTSVPAPRWPQAPSLTSGVLAPQLARPDVQKAADWYREEVAVRAPSAS